MSGTDDETIDGGAGKFILVEALGIEPGPFASKATVLETVCAPYTAPRFNINGERSRSDILSGMLFKYFMI